MTNCDNVENLTKLETYIPPTDEGYFEANFCGQTAEIIHTRTKYIFIMDHSGSNKDNYQLSPEGKIIGAGGPEFGTDPTGDRRYSDLIKFLDKNPEDDPDMSYALIRFSNSALLKTGFTTKRETFKGIVDQLWHNADAGADSANPKPLGVPDDGGFTNFYSALESARILIEGDYAAKDDKDPITGEQIAKTYIVVFISDGFPIIGWKNNDVTQPIMQNTETILLRVRSMMSFGDDHPDRISSINLFTGFYFLDNNFDPKARDLLATMAHAGRGEAYTFSNESKVDFSLFQVPTKIVKYGIEALFVSNRNVVWWDGQRQLDTDMDGLPDDAEAKMGSNKTLYDTDGNGVSDSVEYFLNKSLVATGTLYCGGMAFSTVTKSVSGVNKVFRIYPDTDKDGLNDCEELLLSGFKSNFDSNEDLVPDGRTLFGGFLSPLTTTMKNDNDLDGVENGDEIKWGTPLNIANFQLLGTNPYHYDLKIESSNSTQDCYKLRVTGLPHIGNANTVRLEFIETAPVLRKRKTYRAAEKVFPVGSNVLMVNELPNEDAGVWK